MPLNIDFVQVLLHILNFVILAGGLTLILQKPVKKFMDERKAKYEAIETKNREDAEANERVKAEYEEKLASFDKEMAELRLETEREAGNAARSTIDTAKSEAARILKKAEEDAEKRKDHILESAQTEISELVLTSAQKLLADSATPERTRELYDEFLKFAEKDVPQEESNA